jgi:hypothetical protein
MQWGVNTAELENLRRLTPSVFRPDKVGDWHVQYDLQFPPNEATQSNARYCLDRAISILLRRQQHLTARRWPSQDVRFTPPTIYLEAPVFEKASPDSTVIHRISEGYEYTIRSRTTGFNPAEEYYYISGKEADPQDFFKTDWIYGFLLVQEYND